MTEELPDWLRPGFVPNFRSGKWVSHQCPPDCEIKAECLARVAAECNGMQLLECDRCEYLYEKKSADKIVKSIKYPHMNLSLGEVVTSADHGRALAKQRGLVEEAPLNEKWWGYKSPKTDKNIEKWIKKMQEQRIKRTK